MAFGTFTLTGHFDDIRGIPALGRVKIDGVPQVIIDTAGKEIFVGPRTLKLDAQGNFSFDLPSNATTGNSTTIAYRITVMLLHQNLAPVEFYARPMGTTVDLSNIIPQQVVPLSPTGVSQADLTTKLATYVAFGPTLPALPTGTEYVWNKTDGAGTLLDIVSGVA